ncbi:hypothetical protein BFL35_14035 [Clavibacter michiganensis]|nr:hypothetical protein BFL35_14035 [Clavibacter michiganensis]
MINLLRLQSLPAERDETEVLDGSSTSWYCR